MELLEEITIRVPDKIILEVMDRDLKLSKEPKKEPKPGKEPKPKKEPKIVRVAGKDRAIVLAKKIKIVDWLETFVNEDVNVKRIHITEKRTGMSIGTGNNQTEAKARVLKKIEELGKEPFLAMVEANEL